MRSLSAALEHAMAKKTVKKGKSPGGLIHSSFPPPGGMQPSFMGSQSAPPGAGGGMPPMGMPSGMPSMGEEPGAYGPGY